MDREEHAAIWVINGAGSKCDHRGEDLRLLANDGLNSYHRCARCDAVLVARIGDRNRVSPAIDEAESHRVKP